MNASSVERRVLLSCGIAILVASVAIAIHAQLDRERVLRGEKPEIFDYLFYKFDAPAALVVVGLVVVAFALALAMRWSPGQSGIGWLDRKRWWIAGATTPLLAIASVEIYRAHPLSMDEYAAMFQAQLFAGGRAWAEFAPSALDWVIPSRFFNHFFTLSTETGWVVSTYWPGFSLLLAPFVFLGAPWLLNPLLGAGSLLLVAHIARRLWVDDEVRGRDAAGWALLLALASPQLVVTSISFYSMPAHLFANLAFAALLLQPTPRRAALAGVVGSFALVLHQPIPHALFALPWLAWLAQRGRRGSFWALIAGYIPLGLLLGPGWTALRGFVRGATVATSTGTGPDGSFVVTTLLNGFRHFEFPTSDSLIDRMMGLEKLFLWAVPGLPIFAVCAFVVLRKRSGVELLGASALLSLAGYLFVPYDQGHGWGYRYFHQAWGVLPILGGCAIAYLGRERPEWRRAALVLALGSGLVLVPLRLSQVHEFVSKHLEQLPPLEEGASERQVGATGPSWVRFVDIRVGYYREDLIQNDPLLQAPVLTLVSHGRVHDAKMAKSLSPGARRVSMQGNDSVWELERVVSAGEAGASPLTPRKSAPPPPPPTARN